jgi:hypothetical protein
MIAAATWPDVAQFAIVIAAVVAISWIGARYS